MAEEDFNKVYSKILKSAVAGEVKSPYYFVDLEKVKATLKIWANSIRIFSEQHKD
ncbi:hypothetical protein LEP1GSC169_0077 [Leptospira santarosai str. HAI1349]|nr:hypothetical protein LEP1GSC169_0077 [Leptospira santarosai str. HAI1349]